MDKGSDKKLFLLISFALVVITAAVYYQVYSFEFLDFDDPGYVYKNSGIQTGLTFQTIKWALTTGYGGNWHPLTWLSHSLDWQLFGSNPAGHHVMSLVFHIANTLLLFFVLRKMTGMLWPSAFVAALFALHPLHVESVAWVSERKDVLSTFFWTLTMLAYFYYTRRPTICRYLLVVISLALGLMSKPMLVTLPFVLLLIDYWPLYRIGSGGKKTGSGYSFVYLLIEKIPLFVMILVSCIVTFIVQRKGGAMVRTVDLEFPFRLANASISYLQYITKMVCPMRLAALYPHPGKNISFLYAALSAALLAAVTILILLFAKKRRYLVTGWFWYLGTLVPVIGLVQVGYQSMADRYSYIPLTGLFIIIAWGAGDLLTKQISADLPQQALRHGSGQVCSHTVEPRCGKIMLTLSALLIILFLSICTCFQLRCWRNNMALFKHALEVTRGNFRIHHGMAKELIRRGYIEEAIRHNKESLRIMPDDISVLNDLGTALCSVGRVDEARSYYKRAIEVDPCDSEAWFSLASILVEEGKSDEAVSLCRRALQITPSFCEIRAFLALTLADIGKFDEAVGEYEEFLRLNPRDAVSHNDFAVILFRQGKIDEAVAHFERAVQIDPAMANAKKNLDAVLTARESGDLRQDSGQAGEQGSR